MAKALKEMQRKLPVYSVTVDQQAIDAAQGGFEGMEFVSFLTPQPEFAAAYAERYHIPIDIGADSAYDAVMLLADAIRASQSTDSEQVARSLASTSMYNGVSGSLVSDGKRAFTKSFVVMRVRDGKAAAVTAN